MQLLSCVQMSIEDVEDNALLLEGSPLADYLQSSGVAPVDVGFVSTCQIDKLLDKSAVRTQYKDVFSPHASNTDLASLLLHSEFAHPADIAFAASIEPQMIGCVLVGKNSRIWGFVTAVSALLVAVALNPPLDWRFLLSLCCITFAIATLRTSQGKVWPSLELAIRVLNLGKQYERLVHKFILQIQEVELVSRGYKLSSRGIGPVERLEHLSKERRLTSLRRTVEFSLRRILRTSSACLSEVCASPVFIDHASRCSLCSGTMFGEFQDSQPIWKPLPLASLRTLQDATFRTCSHVVCLSLTCGSSLSASVLYRITDALQEEQNFFRRPNLHIFPPSTPRTSNKCKFSFFPLCSLNLGEINSINPQSVFDTS